MSLPLLLCLNNDSLRKIFFESKRLLNGLQLCKDIRKVLLKGHLFAHNDLTHLVVKDIENLKGSLRRSPSLPGKWILEQEGINLFVGALKLWGHVSTKLFCGYEKLGIPSSPTSIALHSV